MDNTRFKTVMITVAITMIIVLSLVSFGFFYVSLNQNDKNHIAGGCFSSSFSDGESINLQNAFPQSFDEAKENDPYEFTLTNTCDLSVKYYILLNVKSNSLNSSFIDYSLNTKDYSKLSEAMRNTKYSIDEGYTDSYIIGSGFLKKTENKTEYLRLWIDESVSQNDIAANSKFTAKVKIVTEVGDSAAISTFNKLQLLNHSLKISNHNPDFSKVAPELPNDNETGIYTMEDDYGQSVYFRGDIVNNYVKFGKNSSGSDMYWRIVRINGNGSVRLIYDGTQAHENGEISDDRILEKIRYNLYENGAPFDHGYGGYMYGSFPKPVCEQNGTLYGVRVYVCSSGGSSSYEEAHQNINNSNIKNYIDNWYKLNLYDTNYNKYISDEIFCNDRSSDNINVLFGQNHEQYSSYPRLIDNSPLQPTLICLRKNDSFTTYNNIHGNNDLTYPVGLVTADEIVITGHNYRNQDNKKSFMYKGNTYWGMTPFSIDENGGLNVSILDENGRFSVAWVASYSAAGSYYGVAPVINLKSEYVDKLSGTGEMNNPFYINEN